MSSAEDEEGDWEIEGRVRLEREDWLHAWPHVPQFRTIWQYVLFMPLSFVLIVVGSPVPWRSWLSYAPWAVASVPLAAFAVWAYRNHWATGLFTRVGRQQIVYAFDAEGMRVSSGSGALRFPWAAIFRAIETPQAFLVFVQSSQFFVMPKRAFAPDDLSELAELLASVPKRRSRIVEAIVVWLVVCALLLLLLEILQNK